MKVRTQDLKAEIAFQKKRADDAEKAYRGVLDINRQHNERCGDRLAEAIHVKEVAKSLAEERDALLRAIEIVILRNQRRME